MEMEMMVRVPLIVMQQIHFLSGQRESHRRLMYQQDNTSAAVLHKTLYRSSLPDTHLSRAPAVDVAAPDNTTEHFVQHCMCIPESDPPRT
jgi:hypothetical protein